MTEHYCSFMFFSNSL